MRKYSIVVLKGDGIGPEVIDASIRVLKEVSGKFGFSFEFEECKIGAVAIDEYGEPLTDETIEKCAKADAILLGAIGDPKYDNAPNLAMRPEQGLLKLRKALGLFANIRPVKAFEAILSQSPLKGEIIKGVDFVIFRELTGGIYFGDKGYSDSETAFDHCTYSVKEIDRILHLAFQEAQRRRNKLTLVDKANVLETSRLWRKRAHKLHENYEDVKLDYLFVDNAAMQIILNPKQFDVIVTENMFGDILSDEASVIAGSIGLLASKSVGKEGALFEPIHGSFPAAAGKNSANPVASILSGALMLEYLGQKNAADAIHSAVDLSLKSGIVTAEISAKNGRGTSQVTDFIVASLAP